ncbi:unnamed protein product, partial [Allacma fusca]
AADAIATPLFGLEAKRSIFFCKSYGRCKSWHLLGAVVLTLSFPFVFMVCLGCENTQDYAKIVYYAPFAALSQIGWASTQISHLAIIPKMSPDELVRTEILAIRYAFTVGANITVFLLAYVILGLDEALSPQDSYKFTEIALIGTCIGLAATVIFHMSVEEKSDVAVKRSVAFLNSLPSSDARRHSIYESMQCSTRNTPYGFNYQRQRSTLGKYSEEARTAILHRNVAGGQSGAEGDVSCHLDSGREGGSFGSSHPHTNSVLGHLHHSLQVITQSVQNLRPTNPLSTTWLSLGREKMEVLDWLKMFQFYVVGLIYMATRLSVNVTQVYVPLFLQKSLRLSVGSLATLSFIFGAVLSISGSLLIAFLDWEGDPGFKSYAIYFVGALLGGGGSAMLVTSLSITADLIGSNVESGAFVYGAMSFTDKLSCGIVISLINYAAPCQEDAGSCDSSLEVSYYRDSLATVCGGTSLIGVMAVVILTMKIYIQNRDKFYCEVVSQ